jgi:multidrug resistance protein, MATE family
MNALTKYLDRKLPNSRPVREEARALTHLAVPMACTHLSYMAAVTTDVVMMGWLGADALAAGSLAGNFFWFFELFALGLLLALSPILAQHLGARRFRMVRPVIRQGLWLSVIAGIPCAVVMWHSGTIFIILGQDPDLSADAQSYLRAMVFALFPGLMHFVFAEFLDAHARPRATLVIALFGIGLNAIINYALMFGNFGFPRLELVGAGIASAVVSTVTLVMIACFVLTDRKFRRYHLLGRFWRADWAQMMEIIRLGVPIAITDLSEMGLFLASALFMGLISTDALAAHAIVTQSCGIVLMIPAGISQAVSIRVGRAEGAGDSRSSVRAGKIAMVMSTVVTLLPMLVFWFAGGFVVDLFLDQSTPENQRAAELGVSFLMISGVFMMADCFQLTVRGVLRGCKDTHGPMKIALSCYWGLGLTSAGFFGVYLGYGGEAVWIGMTVAWWTAAALIFRRLLRHQAAVISASS